MRLRAIGQNSAEVADAVREGSLEAGMVILPVEDVGLEVRSVQSEELLYVSADPGRTREPMTIERLAEAPLILYDARWAAQDPARRQLRERAQLAGVRIEPVIEVEYMTAAFDLALRGLGDTISVRSLLRSAGTAHDDLRPADPRDLRPDHPPRSAPLARHPRLHGDGRRGAHLRRYDQFMAGATIAEDEYLQTIFWLHEAGLPITGANIARAMQLSAPTVHEMVGRLEKDGFITRAADKSISFTPEGLEQAESVVRRHRLIERFLTDVLNIPWDDVHEEAERMEHAMSPNIEAGMLKAIGNAKTCPHGHPIEPGTRIEGVPLGDTEAGAKVTILRFENEAEDLLHLFMREGLEPGREGVVAEVDDEHLVVDFDGATATLTRSVAETVSVLADPSPPPRTALPEVLVLGKERYGR